MGIPSFLVQNGVGDLVEGAVNGVNLLPGEGDKVVLKQALLVCQDGVGELRQLMLLHAVFVGGLSWAAGRRAGPPGPRTRPRAGSQKLGQEGIELGDGASDRMAKYCFMTPVNMA